MSTCAVPSSSPSSGSDHPDALPKKMKLDDPSISPPNPMPAVVHCKHFVQRKKRFCKMSVGRGQEYCGEHLPQSATEHSDKDSARIPCPLDPKHSIFARNLQQHMRICNAKQPTVLPAYIRPGVNLGPTDDEAQPTPAIGRLADIEPAQLVELIAKIHRIYEHHRIDGQLLHTDNGEHQLLSAELQRPDCGPDTRKHLLQISALLGLAQQRFDLATASHTSYVEFGAGKGQLSLWLAHAIKSTETSNVLLVDRASLRHKQDNRFTERDGVVRRLRADIADLWLAEVTECAGAERRLIGVGKHLCGAATDFALRCLMDEERRATGVMIALCCHHRCDWRAYVGREFFVSVGLTPWDFAVMVKLVSWAVCGQGMSRETRKALHERPNRDEDAKADEHELPAQEEENSGVKLTREERELIGRRCKRLLDYGRVRWLRDRFGWSVDLCNYVGTEVTLENVCIVGHPKVTKN